MGGSSKSQSVNDQKIMDFLHQKLSEVTRELKETQNAYAELQSRSSPTTDREAFLLQELERVNLQLECKTILDHRDLFFAR